MNLSQAQFLDEVKEYHDTTNTYPMRWGYNDGDSVRRLGGSCNYSAASFFSKKNFYYVFQGDGPEYPFELLSDPVKRAKFDLLKKKNLLKFEGTERTEKFVSFLVSEKSPWAVLKDQMVTDAKFINNGAFVFRNPSVVNHKILYNFLMAVRFPWECPALFTTYNLLLKEGLHEKLALYVSMNFMLSRGAESIKGPWQMVYPWSFLESGSLECAGRFISGKPRLKVENHFMPNVLPIWACGSMNDYKKEMADLSVDDLYLPKILFALNEICEKQSSQIEKEDNE